MHLNLFILLYYNSSGHHCPLVNFYRVSFPRTKVQEYLFMILTYFGTSTLTQSTLFGLLLTNQNYQRKSMYPRQWGIILHSPPLLLHRDLCALRHGLCVHASQVCSGGRPAAHHRLPQLDADSSAEQHGEHPHHRGDGPGATLRQGVPQVVGAQWSGATPPPKWPKSCSRCHKNLWVISRDEHS